MSNDYWRSLSASRKIEILSRLAGEKKTAIEIAAEMQAPRVNGIYKIAERNGIHITKRIDRIRVQKASTPNPKAPSIWDMDENKRRAAFAQRAAKGARKALRQNERANAAV